MNLIIIILLLSACSILPKKITLAGTAGTAGVSERLLQNCVNDKYENIKMVVTIADKPKGHLTIECDEMRTFVRKKKNKCRIWLAKDADTKEIVGVHVGSRKSGRCPGIVESDTGCLQTMRCYSYGCSEVV